MKLKAKYQRLDETSRLYGLSVPVIGLTGGIATGKTTVGHLLMTEGFSLINADHLVKDIYSLPVTFDFIEANYPSVVHQGVISFPELRAKVFTDPQVKQDIEDLIYKRLPSAFLQAYQKFSNPEVIIYDVPLLFEKNLKQLFDLNVLVYAPRKIQLARLITRDGHTEDLAEKILDQQMDIEVKKPLADFVIQNSRTEAELMEDVQHFLHQYFE